MINNTKENLPKLDIFLITIISLYNLILVSFSIIWLFTIIFNDLKTKVFQQENIYLIIGHIFVAGIIGGSCYSMRALYQRLGYSQTPINQNLSDQLNIKAWFLWYLYRPLQGGILAAIIVCLFQHGFININTTSANLDSLYFQVGIGFLVGFGAHDVMNKIEEIIKVIFAKNSKHIPKSNAAEKVQENIKGGTNV